MKWITEITLDNYKAFAKPETIKIPKNQHLLIYGENGSGKSSVYSALKDLFYTSFTTSVKEFELNQFEKKLRPEGSVKIQVTDFDKITNKNNGEPVSYIYSENITNSTHQVGEIQLANKIKGFLDYKKLLKIHAINYKPNEKPNFFNLIIKDLLGETLIDNPAGGTTKVYLLKEYERISNILCRKRNNSNLYKKTSLELTNFINTLQNLLKEVFSKTNEFLKIYFQNKIQIDISLGQIRDYQPEPFWKKEMYEKLELKIKYSDSELESYHTILNEARLSSVVTCIFLSSILTVSSSISDLRILYLDDIFIGLDTGNRIPILEILREEFIKTDFQIFISTYDRNWFELARIWFETQKCKFHSIEMFVETSDNNLLTPDIPIILDAEEPFERAIKYFKNKDYPAAANYLRKSCEKELKRILPIHLKLLPKYDTGEIKEIVELEKLIDNFKIFMTENSLDYSPFNDFKIYRKIVFNPLSHDDIKSPHYREEILSGIKLVENLKNIKKVEIVKVEDCINRPMEYRPHDNITKIRHFYLITVYENLYAIKQDTSDAKLCKVKCSISEGGNTQEFDDLYKAFDQIWIERKYLGNTDYSFFHRFINVNSHQKLIDKLNLI